MHNDRYPRVPPGFILANPLTDRSAARINSQLDTLKSGKKYVVEEGGRFKRVAEDDLADDQTASTSATGSGSTAEGQTAEDRKTVTNRMNRYKKRMLRAGTWSGWEAYFAAEEGTAVENSGTAEETPTQFAANLQPLPPPGTIVATHDNSDQATQHVSTQAATSSPPVPAPATAGTTQDEPGQDDQVATTLLTGTLQLTFASLSMPMAFRPKPDYSNYRGAKEAEDDSD